MVEILQKYFNLFQQMIYLLERCLSLSLSLSHQHHHRHQNARGEMHMEHAEKRRTLCRLDVTLLCAD